MAAPSNPTPPTPGSGPDSKPVERRKIASAHFLRVRGQGRVEVELSGSGQLSMIRGRYDDFCFEGRGLPRHLSGTCVHLRAAQGRVILEGEDLELEFFGGVCSALLVGTFEVEERGPGSPHAGSGGGAATGRTTRNVQDKRSASPRRRV